MREKILTFGLTVMLLVSVVGITVGGLFEEEVETNELMGDVIEVYTWEDLYNMRDDLAGSYRLMNDLGPEDEGYDDYNAGKGWLPIGNNTNRFTGSFNGRNNTIGGLYIDRPGTSYIGLFGYVDTGGEVRNVGIVDADVSGTYWVGGLVGMNSFGTVENSYATGNATGNWWVGGLVGENEGTVENSYATGNVSGDWFVGGLVGWNDYGTVENSYATGSVSGYDYVGGLVGLNGESTVSNSYATGNVSGHEWVGGLVGWNYGTVSNSYATGSVSGDREVGGLVGYNEGMVMNSYATGTVTGTEGETLKERVGGLVGLNYGTVSNSYATGSVSGEWGDVGGLVGLNYGTVSNSFWDIETSGMETSDGGEGKTTADMMTESTFTDAGWDFVDIWFINEGLTYPLFQWQDMPDTTHMVLDLQAYGESDGWNFVSFNLLLDGTDLEDSLANIEGKYDRMMYYDASTDQWSSYVPDRAEHFNNLDTWNHRMGIWIRMTENATLTVEGYVPTSTDITLYPGWNMVGLPSESGGNHGLPAEVTRIGYFEAMEEYNVAYSYDPDSFVFEPGQGYWLYNGGNEPVIWTVEY